MSSIDRYDPIRVIGEGSFGKVYLMRDKVKRNFVCIKIIKIKNIPKKEREATKAEVDLLRRLNHPNIVRYLDSFLSKNNESLCICMEYCDGGDLASQVKAARRNLFSESKVLHWFVQIALGLHYMHANKVLHRDLKTQNVFLLGNGRLVLGDLGISKVLDGTMDFAQTCIGTPYYMSPEIFKNKPYSYKSDVWALGCVLYEMTTLSHAFDANSLNGLATKIVKGKYPPIHAKYSRFLRELIGQMLLINPAQRPDLEQILQKPFIKKHIVNFFTDIAARPSQSIGEGTMIVKAAAGGAVNGAVGNDSNMISLRQQLHSLGLTAAVSDALGPRAAPVDNTEAQKLAREQVSALKREQEHKKMVEAALEKLRKEREERAKERVAAEQRGGLQRPSGYPRQRGSAAIGGASAAAGNGYSRPSVPSSSRPSAYRAGGYGAGAAHRTPTNASEAARKEAASGVGGGGGYGVRDRGMNWNKKSDEDSVSSGVSAASRHSAGREKLIVNRGAGSEQDSGAVGGGAGAGVRPRRSSFGGDDNNNNGRNSRVAAERERRAVEERKRQQQEQDSREQRAREDRKREEVRLEARAREIAKQKEEAKQQEELSAQKKLQELRQQADLVARRDAHRERERERQRSEIEQLKRDKLELDRRAHERDRLREERRAQERARLEGINVNSGRRDPAEEKESTPSHARKVAEDKLAELSARERVLVRKQEKQQREEADRLEALRAAENENRRIRAQAVVAHRREYNADYAVPSAAAAARDGRRAGVSDDEYGAKGVGGGGGRRARGPMDMDELNNKLDDLNGAAGRDSRYEPSYPSEGGGGGSNSRARRANDLGVGGVGDGGGLDDHDSEEEEEDSGIWHNASGDAEEEEEDLHRKEEELRAELDFATMRVSELKRTLQETKSFMGQRGGAPPASSITKDRGAVAAPQLKVAGGSGVDEEEEEEEEEEDEDYEDDYALAEADETEGEEDASPAVATPKSVVSKSSGTPTNAESTLRLLRPSDVRIPNSYNNNNNNNNLQDPPSPMGRLSDRIQRLRQRCTEALGREAFNDAYSFLKQHEEESQGYENGRDLNDDDFEQKKLTRMRAILGQGKVHYMSLIEQLIFMEETHAG